MSEASNKPAAKLQSVQVPREIGGIYRLAPWQIAALRALRYPLLPRTRRFDPDSANPRGLLIT